MITFERIKFLANKQGKSLNQVEEDLGYGKNVLYRLKNSNPSTERLQEIADYFDVSVDYLLGLSDTPERMSKTKQNGDGFLRIDLSAVPENEREGVANQLETFKNYIISETLKEAQRRKNESDS